MLTPKYAIEILAKSNDCALSVKKKCMSKEENGAYLMWKRECFNKMDNKHIVLYAIKGAGHSWPDYDYGEEKIPACELIWEFFQKLNE